MLEPFISDDVAAPNMETETEREAIYNDINPSREILRDKLQVPLHWGVDGVGHRPTREEWVVPGIYSAQSVLVTSLLLILRVG